MFNNLRAEFIKTNRKPIVEIAKILKCTERTARNKIKGVTDISVTEAKAIKTTCFPNLSLEYLFATENEIAETKEV